MSFTVDEFVEELLTWIGTPHHHNAAVKGSGCDCVGLLRGAYANVSKTPMAEPMESYPPNWWQHKDQTTLLIDSLAKYVVPIESIIYRQPGDIMIFNYPATYSHCGVMVDNEFFLHCWNNANVQKGRLLPWWSRHVSKVLRLKELA